MLLNYLDYRSAQARHHYLCRKLRIYSSIRDRANPFEEFNEHQFQIRFRLRKAICLDILNAIHNDLSKDIRGYCIPAQLQFFVALRFYATGGFLQTIADTFGVSKQSVSIIVERVSRSLAMRKAEFIKFPANPIELDRIRQDFYNIAKFPGVIGAIDCTHIRIACPAADQRARFWCVRKHMYSINVQAVCDAKMTIINIVARWPGSTHDSRIFRNSKIYTELENEIFGDVHLLGDSGYACLPFLMTPYLVPSSKSEENYNFAHSKTRTTIERCFGILKRRYPCLHYGIRTKLSTTLAVVIACAILHNISIQANDSIEELPILEEIKFDKKASTKCTVAGRVKRERIVQQNFPK